MKKEVICAIGGFELPFSITINQMAWVVGVFFAILFFQKLPPLSWIDNPLLKYLVLPAGIAWFVNFVDKKMLNRSEGITKTNCKQTAPRPERTRKRIFRKSYDDVAAYKKDLEERKRNAWAAWEREQKGEL